MSFSFIQIADAINRIIAETPEENIQFRTNSDTNIELVFLGKKYQLIVNSRKSKYSTKLFNDDLDRVYCSLYARRIGGLFCTYVDSFILAKYPAISAADINLSEKAYSRLFEVLDRYLKITYSTRRFKEKIKKEKQDATIRRILDIED